MLFNSLVFVWFLIVMLFLHYVLPRKWSRFALLAGSYVFYGWWDWRFLSLIIISTCIDFFVAHSIEAASTKKKEQLLLTCSVITNLGLLGFFKYFNFFVTSLGTLLNTVGIEVDMGTLNLVLPVGISFYTFQTMSYTIDVYRGSQKAEKNLITFAAFVTFFPQLVAGPIERAGHLLPQLKERQHVKREQIPTALWYILWGFFLKVFMADNLATIVESMYAHLESLTIVDVFVCHYAFAFQIFGDFAGYSYIAVGVAALFGIHLMHNFRFPYFVTNPSDFWKNWHISLSRWLRDYLYIPLGGNRGGGATVHRNLLITMLLGGLWHGAAWNFVLWGGYQGAVLILFRIWNLSRKRKTAIHVPWILKVILMFNVTCAGWLLFRSPDLESIVTMLGQMMNWSNILNWKSYYWLGMTLFFVSVPLALHSLQFIRKSDHAVPFSSALGKVYCCTIMVFLLITLGSWGTKSFIYFQF
ncbi:MAG: MBOAT family protein [Bacteroidia bacterium]|nr:MBOAT family protein [Bacteroidia bacterium]